MRQWAQTCKSPHPLYSAPDSKRHETSTRCRFMSLCSHFVSLGYFGGYFASPCGCFVSVCGCFLAFVVVLCVFQVILSPFVVILHRYVVTLQPFEIVQCLFCGSFEYLQSFCVFVVDLCLFVVVLYFSLAICAPLWLFCDLGCHFTSLCVFFIILRLCLIDFAKRNFTSHHAEALVQGPERCFSQQLFCVSLQSFYVSLWSFCGHFAFLYGHVVSPCSHFMCFVVILYPSADVL